MGFGILSNSRRQIGASIAIALLFSGGLGAAILLYTALDRLILHPLHLPHPGSLVRAAAQVPPRTSWEYFPYNSYEVIRAMHSFVDVAIEGTVDTTITTSISVQPAVALMVSSNYFSLLEVPAEVGRVFVDADETLRSGEIPVVLSHRFWMREFAGIQALGSHVKLQGLSYIVIGVMPDRFLGSTLDTNPDLWLPLSAQPQLSQKALTDPVPDRHFSVLARLKQGVTIEQAQAEFAVTFSALEQAAGRKGPKRKGIVVPIAQGTFALREQFSRALTLLLWGLGTLLLMVCASVVGLLIAKATHNERDTAVRIALGASRGSLVRRASLESALNGLMGACGAICIASFCASPMSKLLPAGTSSPPISLAPSWQVDFLAILLALALSLSLGSITAWVATRVDPQVVLRGGSATKRTGIVSRGLLIVQTGATLILLVGTGLLLHTFYVLRHTSPGFDVEHLVLFHVNPGLAGPSAHLSSSFPEQLRTEMEAIPGVRSAGFATAVVMQRVGLKTSVARPGQKIAAEAFLNTTLDRVSASFFGTLGIPILKGRAFSLVDMGHSGPSPTVINEAFAHLLFPNEDPVGKKFGMGGAGDMATETNIIVGVAGDSKYRSLREPLLPIYYTPIELQPNWQSQFYLYVRTYGEPSSIIPAARNALARLDAGLTFSEVAPLKQQVAESLWQERLLAILVTIFSIISVLIGWAGLYSLLSYDVNQRSREFGIRGALGAQSRDVILLLVKDVAQIVLPGAIIGLIACLLSIHAIAPLLYGVRPIDPLSLGGALVAIASIGILSAWLPTSRAMRTDPAVVLRKE
ncbi:MAG TPA: ABC transporter permease [Candidatus Saccharimonadales bacterium]|nr:ABC transporter permease [Candidatus Saccharimonadales bacterium]